MPRPPGVRCESQPPFEGTTSSAPSITQLFGEICPEAEKLGRWLEVPLQRMAYLCTHETRRTSMCSRRSSRWFLSNRPFITPSGETGSTFDRTDFAPHGGDRMVYYPRPVFLLACGSAGLPILVPALVPAAGIDGTVGYLPIRRINNLLITLAS